MKKIRLAILKFLYDAHRKAGTIEGSKFQIRELKAELKKLGLEPAEIARNLDYLVQNDWILKETEPYLMSRGRRMISSKRVTYRISSRGIDVFQGPSQFQRPGSPFGISIVQNAPGIVQVGPYNYVNVAFRDLYQSLESLAQAILTSDKISACEQVEKLADIRAFQAQLSKPTQDKTVIQKLWSAIQTVGKIGAFAAFVERIANLVRPLL